MIETMSIWSIAYAGLCPKDFMTWNGGPPDFLLISPEVLDGERVFAFIRNEKSIAITPGEEAEGPATMVCWLAGSSELEPEEFFEENLDDDEHSPVFNGTARFENGTLYLTGRTRFDGHFKDVTEGLFLIHEDQIHDDNRHLITEESFPVVVEIDVPMEDHQ